ncbi:hypothetical protein PHYBOEH_008138 [Phytophthora boehmeriae]|uniref:Uncharacterized protein n=1 Tax=Phytophthora boehmeriae TaxID=109152 RepID=A0A8T1W328_9STRA|nr:hypothetical protein PHYBOEH_008138 [Phytophthora boehmeriae]
MAARVTKLFLQNCAAAKEQTKSSSKRSTANDSQAVSDPTRSKNARGKLRQKSMKVTATKNKTKTKERVLDAARRELAQADRTRDNLRKLKSKLSTKSQRVMAKALAQRTAAFR